MSTRGVVAAISVVAVVSGIVSARVSSYDSRATERWRTQAETDLRAPTGWLTVAGLFFLKPGANSIGADPANDIVLPADGGAPPEVGELRYEGARVFLRVKAGVAATINDRPIADRVELKLADAAQKRREDRVTIGRLTFHLHRSGERLAVRLRDPESPLLRTFTGRRWFPVDSSWAVQGRFVSYEQPRSLPVQNILGDSETSTSPGEVEISIAGNALRLIAFKSARGLSFVLRDGTAGRETYTTRFLSADAPGPNGEVVIDFNRAYNPPCAFNPHTTCPLPPPQNRLTVAIPAGEKLYAAHTSSRALLAAPHVAPER